MKSLFECFIFIVIFPLVYITLVFFFFWELLCKIVELFLNIFTPSCEVRNEKQ